MLVALHRALGRFSKRREATTPAGAPPQRTTQTTGVALACYYLVTVLIPLANGSGDTSRAFIEHMSFVVLAPLTLVGLFAVLRHMGQRAARLGALRRVWFPLSNQRWR